MNLVSSKKVHLGRREFVYLSWKHWIKSFDTSKLLVAQGVIIPDRI